MVSSFVCNLCKGVGFFLISSSMLWAQSKPTVLYLQPIPHYMDSTEQGSYVDLIQRFADENNLKFTFIMASSERIEKLLVRSENDYCSLGFSVELAETEGLPTAHLIESQSFNRIYTSIISSHETQVNSVEELNNSTLVVFHGNQQDALQRIPEGFDTSIVAAYDVDSIINLVLNRRVDAGFVTSPDVFMSPLYQQSKSQLHLVELPDSDRRESLVCLDSMANRKLIDLFDRYIDQLRASGQLTHYIDHQRGIDKAN